MYMYMSYVVLRSGSNGSTALTINSTTSTTWYYGVGDHTMRGGVQSRKPGTYVHVFRIISL